MKAIKPVFKRSDEYKEIFKQSQCLLLISVGQEAHEGERFEATINLINTSFNSCIISLYDSIQRHTMALNSQKDPSFFHNTASKEGDLWLERNEKYYSKLTIPKEITRWNTWLNHPNFFKEHDKLLTLINDDPTYKAVFDNTIEGYLTRYCSRLDDLSKFDHDRAKQICFNYIVEECAVLCLWPELQCQFEIYPNRHNDAIEETRARFITPCYPELLRAIQLGFRNAKQVKPQQFEFLKNPEEATELYGS